MTTPVNLNHALSASPTVTSHKLDPDKKIRVANAISHPIMAWYCIASFIAFISICHFLTLLYHIRRKRLALGDRKRGVVSYRRLPAAVMNTLRAFAFRWTITIGNSYTLNFVEVFLTATYMVVLFLWSLVNATNTTGVKYDPKYWANVAGTVAASQIPLTTALGTKNNIVSLLTGISFDKLNYLHRMSARVLCVLMWLHGAGRFKLRIKEEEWISSWLHCGILGATALAFLCILSIKPLRNRSYEMFLAIHFVLVLIFLLATYYHAQEFKRGYYIWPAFLIWGFDRLLHGIRIIAWNFFPFKLRSKFTETYAQVNILSPDFLQIIFQRPAHVHWLPGQSAYLTIPSVSGFRLEAHPFTISTIDIPHKASASVDKEGNLNIASKSHNESATFKELMFLIRVRCGFTKRLLKAAQKGWPMKVIMDGPYSSPPVLKGFENVVLIAGGSGIAFTLPLLLDLIHSRKQRFSECHRIVFMWTTRDTNQLEWLSDILLPAVRDVPPATIVEIRIFSTEVVKHSSSLDGDNLIESDEDFKSEDSSKRDLPLFLLPGVTIQQGRPCLKDYLEEEIKNATENISVNVCGPHSLADAVRSALRPARFLDVLKGGPTVTLHIEAM